MFNENEIPKTLRDILLQYCIPPSDLVDEFEQCARYAYIPKGEYAMRQGELCTDFVFNRRGLFRVVYNEDELEDTVLFGTAGDVFASMHTLYANEPAIFSLQAIEPSEVWYISFEDMRRMQMRYPALMRWMQGIMIEQMYSFEKRYLFFTNRSAEDRLRNFMRMHNNLRRTPVKYLSRVVPLKYIAQYLKMTQSTLSRMRKMLLQ